MPCALRLFIFEAITFILYLLITQFGESGKNIIQALLHVIVASILLLHKSIQSAPNAIDLHSSSILLPFYKTINLRHLLCHRFGSEKNSSPQDLSHGSTASQVEELSPEFYTETCSATLLNVNLPPSPPRIRTSSWLPEFYTGTEAQQPSPEPIPPLIEGKFG